MSFPPLHGSRSFARNSPFTAPRKAIEPKGIIFFCFFCSLFTAHCSLLPAPRSSIPQFLNPSIPQLIISRIPQFFNSSIPQFNSVTPCFPPHPSPLTHHPSPLLWRVSLSKVHHGRKGSRVFIRNTKSKSIGARQPASYGSWSDPVQVSNIWSPFSFSI